MSGTRQPRVQVLVNGTILPGIVAAQISGTSALQADHFSITAALTATADFGLAWWDAQNTILADLRFSLDGGENFVSLLQGEIDCIRADPVSGLVVAEGRDLSARLIDAQTGESFANQMASDVAILLANRHGLNPSVTRTTNPVGRYYQADHNHAALNRFGRARSEWDVLCELARREGFDLFVQGATLYFQPMEAGQAPVFPLLFSGGVGTMAGLHLQRLPALERGLQINVRSWHSKQGQVFNSSAGASGGVAANVLRSNLTQDQVQAVADQTWRETLSHARQISVRMPGELSLSPRSVLRLAGDVAGWVGDYRISDITRRLDAGGFRQDVVARLLPTSPVPGSFAG